MPIELQVIRASEFVRLDADEHLDFEASAEALQALAQACRKRGLGSALLDLRPVPVPDKPLFTTKEIATLMLKFRDAGFTREQRLAVLYHKDVYGGIRDFAFISRMGGLQVQAFHEFEPALQWLSEAEAGDNESESQEVPVPIQKPKAEPKKLPVTRSGRAGSATTRRAVHRTD